MKRATYKRMVNLWDAGDCEGALAASDELLDDSPAVPVFHRLRGRILEEMGRLEAAVRVYRDAYGLEADARSAECIARVHRTIGDLPSAEWWYRRSLLLGSYDCAYLGLGILLMHHQGRNEDALEVLRQGAQACPENDEMWIGLAEALSRVGRRDEVARCLDLAVRSPFADDGTWCQAANVYELNGDVESAAVLIATARKRYPHSERLGRWSGGDD